MGKFLQDILTVFFGGWLGLIYSGPEVGNYGGIFGALRQIFGIDKYIEIFTEYSGKLNSGQWVGAAFIMLIIVAVLVAVIWVAVYFSVRFFKRLLGSKVVNQDLVDEINNLKREIIKTTREKDRILGMKVAYQGYDVIEGEEGEDTSSAKKEGESRFYKLTEVDVHYNLPDFVDMEYDTTITLEELCDRFRNYAANNPDRPWRKLYYEPKIIRLFFAALATTRLIILQGISGTGKTSLPECIGHFLFNPTTIASVQPSWRDRTEIFGYFNEFTKRFNETEVLRAMYDATYSESVYLTVLDEMNIARVEYYFAEMLSILEMPSREQWVVDLVPSGWPSDPTHVLKGRFKLPENMWFVGTANNDDSTFAISDKVYDRGMPININSKATPFDAPLTSGVRLSYKHLEKLFEDAQRDHKVSEENLQKFEEMDNYVIEHFRLAFGNRIVKQLREFVPVYVACGGSEIDGLDYVLCNKILRKFESLNLSYIRDEVDDYIQYLNDNFGEDNMLECKDYLKRLKKLF
ncbi:MAG: hypothetical protein LBF68_02230 [Christensenellaceae bacterium]|jgi:hypothetical protein|nr:hypothetical protein [Christensenellaceae bacterium]